MKGNKQITKYVTDWLARANEDISAAEILLKESGLVNSICFHCQQAGEKYFKAYLAFQERNVRKIHDLGALLNLCEEIDKSFGDLRPETDFLGKFYTETRYPGDYPEFTPEEAQQALKAAVKIKEFVLEKIEARTNI
jgi:HEPN domain-containing protein